MTKKHGLLLAGVAVVLFGSYSVFALAADEAKAAAEAVTKQADQVAKKDWAEISKDGAALAKEHDLLDVMTVFKLRRPGAPTSGLGVGPKPGEITPDGIEAKIINMSRRPMPPATLEKEQEALIRMGEITAAVASISVHQSLVAQPMGEKTPAKWKGWTEDMYKASQEFIKAVKAKDAEAAKDAASKLNNSCIECHGVFRDS